MKPVSQMTNAELAAALNETATNMHPVMQTEKTLLREAASRLQAPAVAEDGWQPIETAPKDTTEVIVLVRPKVIRLGWYFKPSSRTEGWCDESSRRIIPTHWVPMPRTGGSE